MSCPVTDGCSRGDGRGSRTEGRSQRLCLSSFWHEVVPSPLYMKCRPNLTCSPGNHISLRGDVTLITTVQFPPGHWRLRVSQISDWAQRGLSLPPPRPPLGPRLALVSSRLAMCSGLSARLPRHVFHPGPPCQAARPLGPSLRSYKRAFPHPVSWHC